MPSRPSSVFSPTESGALLTFDNIRRVYAGTRSNTVYSVRSLWISPPGATMRRLKINSIRGAHLIFFLHLPPPPPRLPPPPNWACYHPRRYLLPSHLPKSASCVIKFWTCQRQQVMEKTRQSSGQFFLFFKVTLCWDCVIYTLQQQRWITQAAQLHSADLRLWRGGINTPDKKPLDCLMKMFRDNSPFLAPRGSSELHVHINSPGVYFWSVAFKFAALVQ